MDAVPSNLRGSYNSRFDSFRFNVKIPDEFPLIDFRIASAEQVAPLANLIEEFTHRFQFALTPFGILYRATTLTQTRLCARVLSKLADDDRLRLPIPWLDS